MSSADKNSYIFLLFLILGSNGEFLEIKQVGGAMTENDSKYKQFTRHIFFKMH